MKNVKKQFFKTEGIVCFHGIQSFVKDEVTPEQAARMVGGTGRIKLKQYNNSG